MRGTPPPRKKEITACKKKGRKKKQECEHSRLMCVFRAFVFVCMRMLYGKLLKKKKNPANVRVFCVLAGDSGEFNFEPCLPTLISACFVLLHHYDTCFRNLVVLRGIAIPDPARDTPPRVQPRLIFTGSLIFFSAVGNGFGALQGDGGPVDGGGGQPAIPQVNK